MNPSRWLTWLVFGAFWLALGHHLSAHWNVNKQYSYGWVVPFLAAYLAWHRWRTRPAPNLALPSGKVLIAIGAVAFLPTWLIEQPNPDWRLVSWALALEIVLMTAGAMALLGGDSWRRHFLFPVAFILTAVPWPSIIEQPVIQGLMRFVASTTVELLNVSGIPALQHGNLIEVKAGVLGVDEACSGVRSLQATIMAALFMGELYRFLFFRRLALFLVGILAAILTNIVRTFFLAWNAAQNGMQQVEKWHDPAGVTVLTACLMIVWLAALAIGHGWKEPSPTRGTPPAAAVPLPMTAFAGLCFLATLVGTEIWYHRGPETEPARWAFRPPPDATELRIEPTTADLLQADHSTAATWTEENGARWVLFYFEWDPGPSRSRILARMHRPEICLPAAGLLPAADRGIIPVEAKGFTLPFEASRFEETGGRSVFIYFLPWERRPAGSPAGPGFTALPQFASLAAVFRRERNLGQQTVEFAVFGAPDGISADAQLKEIVPRLIERVEPGQAD